MPSFLLLACFGAGDPVADDGDLIAAVIGSDLIVGHRRVAIRQGAQRKRKNALRLIARDLFGLGGRKFECRGLARTVLVSLSCLKVWSTASTRTLVRTSWRSRRAADCRRPCGSADHIDAVVGQDESARARIRADHDRDGAHAGDSIAAMMPPASPCTMAVLVMGWPATSGVRTTVPFTASSMLAAGCLGDEGGIDGSGRPFLPTHLIGGERLTGLNVGVATRTSLIAIGGRDSWPRPWACRRPSVPRARNAAAIAMTPAKPRHDDTLGVHEIRLPFGANPPRNHLEFA